MKNILAIAILVMCTAVAYAQTYTVTPPAFTAEDEIVLSVDVTGTSLAGYSGDVWIWAWIAEGCPASCDAPTNIDPAGGEKTDPAKMTRNAENPNVYTITMVPSAFYGKPPSQIKKIGFKLKSAAWGDGKQSDNDVVITVDPLIFVPKVNRIFPTKVTKDDVVTLYLDQAVAATPDLKYELSDFTVSITALDAEGNEIGKLEDKAMVNAGKGLHYIRIIPSFNLDSNDVDSIKYRFKSKNSDVESDEFSLVFFK